MTGLQLQLAFLYPFSIHILVGFLTLYGTDNLSTYLRSFTNSFRLGPETGTLGEHVAILQIACAAISWLFLQHGKKVSRHICYGMLIALWLLISLRNFFNNDHALVVGCFYAHILSFTILVFQFEHTVLKSS